MTPEPLKNGMVKLTPDEGKTLFCDLDKQEHSEAIIKEENIKYFHQKEVDKDGN